jgi:cell division cycle 20-like protein 1 (cofactor of APC complex)
MGATDDIYSSSISHAHIAKAAVALNTPHVATAPRSTTPPPQAEKRKSDRKATDEGARSDRATAASVSDPIDPNVLSKALLKEFEDAGRHRDITPGGSPSRKRQRVYGDR